MLSTFFHPQHVFLLEVIEWVVFQLSEIYATNCEQPNVFAHAKFVDRRFWPHPVQNYCHKAVGHWPNHFLVNLLCWFCS